LRPIGTGERSRMMLLVNEDARLSQCIKQIEKLYDVIGVYKRTDIDCALFQKMSGSIPAASDGVVLPTERK